MAAVVVDLLFLRPGCSEPLPAFPADACGVFPDVSEESFIIALPVPPGSTRAVNKPSATVYKVIFGKALNANTRKIVTPGLEQSSSRFME